MNDSRRMSLADPHCHTLASDGMVTPADLVDAAVKAGLDLIAITDHDTMAAAREVQERGEAAGLASALARGTSAREPVAVRAGSVPSRRRSSREA